MIMVLTKSKKGNIEVLTAGVSWMFKSMPQDRVFVVEAESDAEHEVVGVVKVLQTVTNVEE